MGPDLFSIPSDAQESMTLGGIGPGGTVRVRLVFADGGLRKIDEPSRHESFASILRRAARSELSVMGESGAPLEVLKFSMHSRSAIFCAVRVSDVTGEVHLDRLVGAFDCGRILNPKTAASQFRGGMIMGLGMALTEETLLDERNGRIMSTSMADYHVPSHLDVPDIGLRSIRKPLMLVQLESTHKKRCANRGLLGTPATLGTRRTSTPTRSTGTRSRSPTPNTGCNRTPGSTWARWTRTAPNRNGLDHQPHR